MAKLQKQQCGELSNIEFSESDTENKQLMVLIEDNTIHYQCNLGPYRGSVGGRKVVKFSSDMRLGQAMGHGRMAGQSVDC